MQTTALLPEFDNFMYFGEGGKCQFSIFESSILRGLLHDDNFIKAARPAKAAKPPDNFYFVL